VDVRGPPARRARRG